MRVKTSKIRWKRMPGGWKFMCWTGGCENFTGQHCKRSACKEPHCSEHKAQHMLQRHTLPKLRKHAGVAVDTSMSTEVLALLAKLRRQPGVTEVGLCQESDGSYIAWAAESENRPRRETRSKHAELALQNLFLEVRARNRPIAAEH